MINQMFGFLQKEYDTVLGLPLKQGMTLAILFLTPATVLVLFNFNPFVIFLFIPAILFLLLYKFGLDGVLYGLVTGSPNKNNSRFVTNYLTGRLISVSDSIVYTPDNKLSIIKLYTNSYLDAHDDTKARIKIAFNNIIINYSTLVPKLTFRSLNKSLNLTEYFNEVSAITPNLHTSAIHEAFFENYSREYIEISQDIIDHSYYVELEFTKNTRDDTIKSTVNEFIGSLVNYGFNIDATHYPKLLAGDEIYNYYKELLVSVFEDNKYILPIVTEI